jgi:hypothetical protein
MVRNSLRLLAPALAATLLVGCGVADTAVTTAAMAEAKAEEIKAAKATQARIEKKLDEAQAAAAQQREAAEKLTE